MTSKCVPNKGAPPYIAKKTYNIAYIIYYNIYYKCIFYPYKCFTLCLYYIYFVALITPYKSALYKA